jgi:translocation and assembly module TamA
MAGVKALGARRGGVSARGSVDRVIEGFVVLLRGLAATGAGWVAQQMRINPIWNERGFQSRPLLYLCPRSVRAVGQRKAWMDARVLAAMLKSPIGFRSVARLPRYRRLVLALCLGAAGVAEAVALPLRAVHIVGVEGEELANVEALLSLKRLKKAERDDLGEARLAYLLRRAEGEVQRALQPYGYYEATATGTVERDARGISVQITVQRGEPVRIGATDVRIEGEADADAGVRSVLRSLHPREGEVLDHRQYEAGKLAVQRRLLERGYFDAELVTHRIEIRRRAREAAIQLQWRSGARYRFGEVRFEGSQVEVALLQKTIPFERGEPYHQRDLLALNQRLTELDYFGYIDVRPDPETAEGDEVPVVVALTPGKRSIYTAGLSYGTDAGPGVQLGLERRWVNRRGHKLRADIDHSQRRQSYGVTYRIPAFEWAEGWYAFGLNRRFEDSQFVSSQISEAVAQRSGRVRGWDLGLALHARQEAFELGQRERIVQRGDARLVYPALSAERKLADDTLYPSRGFKLRGEFKLGLGALGSQTDFAQFLLDAKLIRPLGASNRLLLRGQVGRTFTDEFFELPPSLRFFAGGDRSIRGYGYQEVGPRLAGQVIGGKNLVTGSVEIEHMFNDSWGAALFADGGDAFNDAGAFRARSGVGAGVRWRSPVGLVRFDLAHGLDDADSAIQIHINIGPDL